MAIYQNIGYSDTGGITERALQDANASASGGLSAGNHTQIVTAPMVWNVAEFNTLTFTWQNNMAVYYWTNPAGSYTNSTRSCCLVLGDGTEVLIGEGDTGTATVDLSQYTNEQKSSVQLRGKLKYYLSTVTNAANKGSITATNVVARGLGQSGNVYCEIGKLYEFGVNDFSQIGKVYDWDGTAMSLIYSAETVYFDGGAVVPFSEHEYHCETTIGDVLKVQHGAQATCGGDIWTTNMQDLNGVGTIRFAISELTLKGNARLRIGVGTDTNFSVWDANDAMWTVYKDITAVGEHTLDVSHLNGGYYIKMSLGVSTAAYSNFTCTKIIGE